MAPSFHLFTLVAFLNAVIVRGGNTTCKDQSVTWYNNGAGKSPCLVLQDLMQICNPTFDMWTLLVPPLYNICANNSCCCNTVAYALESGCWVCQTDTPYPPSNPASLGTFMGGGVNHPSTDVLCPADTNFSSFPQQYLDALPEGEIPPWAFLSSNLGLKDVWVYAAALSNGTEENALSTASPNSTPNPNPTHTGVGSTHNKNTAAIAGGVVGGIAALALISAAITYSLLKRRRRSEDKLLLEPVLFSQTSELPTPFVFPSTQRVASSTSQGGTLRQPDTYFPDIGSSNPITSSGFAQAGSKEEEINRMRHTYTGSSVSQANVVHVIQSAPGSSRTSNTPLLVQEQDSGLSFDAMGHGPSGNEDLPPAYHQALPGTLK